MSKAFIFVLAVSLCLPLACTRNTFRPSVLLVVIDTLRGDRIGPLGYTSAATPVLDSLAQTGVCFTQAMTPVPVTLPAVTSLLTGLYPAGHGVRDNDTFVLDASHTTLAEQFHEAGYRTGAVLGSAVLAKDRGLDRGFDTYDDAFAGPYPVYTPDQQSMAEVFASTRRRADTVTRLASDVLRGFGADPYFLLVHYFDVHMYYDPPPEFARLHPGNPYDGEVSFVDRELGRLLETLPDPENTLVWVVADHGESQNEHGEPQHGFLLYQSTLHVPMILSGPGVPRGAMQTEPVDLIDVAPTLTAWLHLQDPREPFNGRVLSRTGDPGGEHALFAETLRPLISYGWAPLFAVRRGNLKFISGGGRDELYDLSRDPGERSPLPLDEAGPLKAALTAWRGDEDVEAVRRQARGLPDPGRRELLESLGYVGSSGESETRDRPHPQEALPGWLETQTGKELKRVAIQALDVEDFEALAAVADSVVALLPADAEAYYLRAESRRHRQREAAAREDYLKAAELGGDKLAWTARARLAEMEHREDDAMTWWQSVLEVDPHVWPAVEFVANRYRNEGDCARALPYFERLVDMNPRAGEAQLGLADCAWETELWDVARHHYAAWLEAHPHDPRAEEIRARLDGR